MKKQKKQTKNRTMMQYFEWYLPEDSMHWKRAAEQAESLGKAGINMVWLPPAGKAAGGKSDVGYAVYDLYDLGEFDQKGSIPTKYGTKEEYLAAIRAMHDAGIEVIGDMVLNHRIGADEKETVKACKVEMHDRLRQAGPVQEIEAWTRFLFPGRKGKYSDFQWSSKYFDGTDFDAKSGEKGIFLFENQSWDPNVDDENGNFDYLMGVDLSLDNEEVYEELKRYGLWFTELTGIDGYRLDAVKHMDAGFYKRWLQEMRKSTGKELFTVGEYWHQDVNKLLNYISCTEGSMSLFDVPLHYKFHHISNANGTFPMSQLLTDTLTGKDSWHSVTFVENHDSQPGQALESPVAQWMKPLAYAVILLQEKGIPCVFYGDYYGIPHSSIEPVAELGTLLSLRRDKAYGPEHDYYDNDDIVGFTREGEQAGEGLAVLMSDSCAGSKKMLIGKSHAGQTFTDALGKCAGEVVIDGDGYGEFATEGGSVSVWIQDQPSS